MPLEFAINNSASPLGSDYTPFYADSGPHPRRPLASTVAPDQAGPGEDAATLIMMGRVTEEVRVLLQERRPRRSSTPPGGTCSST